MLEEISPVLAIDLGATKAALAICSASGEMLQQSVLTIQGHGGPEVARILIDGARHLMDSGSRLRISAIGVCVPGISFAASGRVWAPNIPGWDDYPLRAEISDAFQGLPVCIDSDRACYILGENWQGAARGARHAIYLSVGTGIGAGILVDGKVLRGAHDIAGAIGWMALDRPYNPAYKACGCFETHASGGGLGRKAALWKAKTEQGRDGFIPQAADLLAAAAEGDAQAQHFLDEAIECWGMAVANLVSLFNPEMIVVGGGVFGPAVAYLSRIEAEARKWAQPIAMQQVQLLPSALGGQAGLLGAAWMALQGGAGKYSNT